MGDWIETTIGEFCPFEYGKGLKGTDRQQGDVPVFGSNGIVGYHNQAIVESKGVIIGRKGTVGAVHYSDKPFCPIDTAFYIAESPDKDIRYIYFLLKSIGLEHMNSDSAVPGLNRTAAHSRIIEVPKTLEEQRAIAGILGALDDKIELNRRMNATLESIARTTFRQWFVENEDVGKWDVGRLGDAITNFDSKRVPLANRERAQRQGKYPYYGAASAMDYIDDYLFDGIYVLMAEDGSVIGDNDHPVIQYVWGKFWVNNHAHVLRGANGICNEHLYLFLKEVNILPYVTGAVQPKLNQANMNSIPFVVPPKELCKKFEEFVSPLFARIRANDEESRTLASLRDSLLPKLMRGEVRVREVEVKEALRSSGDEARAQAYRRHLRPNDRYRRR